MSTFDWSSWFNNQDIIGGLLGIVIPVLIVETLLPALRKKRLTAQEKLENYYYIAYAFVKIREDFSIMIGNKVHNKSNCGYFHNFNFESSYIVEKFNTANILQAYDKVEQNSTGIVFDENKFFEYTAEKLYYLDSDLRELFIKYFKARGPENVQKRLGCEDSTLIELRKQIEIKIIDEYTKYKSIIER